MTTHRPFIPTIRDGTPTVSETVCLAFIMLIAWDSPCRRWRSAPTPRVRAATSPTCHGSARMACPCRCSSYVPFRFNLYSIGQLTVGEIKSSVFTSGVVLLLNVWSGKRTGLPPHMNSAITEVHKCMATMAVCEERCAAPYYCCPLSSSVAQVADRRPLLVRFYLLHDLKCTD
jgi:hypothetical protein